VRRTSLGRRPSCATPGLSPHLASVRHRAASPGFAVYNLPLFDELLDNAAGAQADFVVEPVRKSRGSAESPPLRLCGSSSATQYTFSGVFLRGPYSCMHINNSDNICYAQAQSLNCPNSALHLLAAAKCRGPSEAGQRYACSADASILQLTPHPPAPGAGTLSPMERAGKSPLGDRSARPKRSNSADLAKQVHTTLTSVHADAGRRTPTSGWWR
jgi:hypothetical protein